MADLADLPELTAAISTDLAGAAIPHAISGAIAMAAHGYIRSTADLDILVVVPSLRLPQVFELVRRHGFEGEDRALIASLREQTVARLVRGPTFVEILVPVLPYHHGILARAVVRPLRGRQVPFVSIADLIVLKMLWHRVKDVADIHGLLAQPGATSDGDFIRRTLRSLIPASDPRHAEIESLLRTFGRD
ncbi:MAG: hypothetical protein WAT39_18690 [Planctomycetota bacterium]